MAVNTIKIQAFERRTDFRTGTIYFLLFREIKVASYTFRLRPIHGNSLKEINFFEPKCTGPLLERLRLKSPETLSAYSTERCGSALKLPCSELTVANNLRQLLFQKLKNCSNSTYVQHYKLLNQRYYLEILKHLKLSKLNSAFKNFLFLFSFFGFVLFFIIFTIQTNEEEQRICFMIEIIMIIIKKTQK